ncbi:hypothetical protein HBH56_091860 [Parastagonospora nodorum]|uniref:Uncharacterized protein n=1 Tax=Phaeosphaeria nodorum (strain SN15 / ATCC MYA-4574 / FGSC 10173) TaxID=321614 RepID=A0A7U2F446_PHANO|nr:hypothetical protein HBH56_091860 [Parastagonospora nodorum]QRC98335.1 hypothetical protein JI435_435600 [Parastagonospora nodorum SN15]KAH3936074.1 hypothetical protein HBH54_026500 [Parastagonospora nodorum]KAH4076599.1 hypothetical protein HBH50_007810 [Parastagonospora nodorum]KAH4095920.1 hypothetical protein HBH48_049980 [Parastagonospora nodorum]
MRIEPLRQQNDVATRAIDFTDSAVLGEHHRVHFEADLHHSRMVPFFRGLNSHRVQTFCLPSTDSPLLELDLTLTLLDQAIRRNLYSGGLEYVLNTCLMTDPTLHR